MNGPMFAVLVYGGLFLGGAVLAGAGSVLALLLLRRLDRRARR